MKFAENDIIKIHQFSDYPRHQTLPGDVAQIQRYMFAIDTEVAVQYRAELAWSHPVLLTPAGPHTHIEIISYIALYREAGHHSNQLIV